jgi:hypothetical protein
MVASVLPSKTWNSCLLAEGRKEVICNTIGTLQGTTYPGLLLDLQDKKVKIPTTGTQGIENLTKTNSRCINLNL